MAHPRHELKCCGLDGGSYEERLKNAFEERLLFFLNQSENVPGGSVIIIIIIIMIIIIKYNKLLVISAPNENSPKASMIRTGSQIENKLHENVSKKVEGPKEHTG